ncbi:hypothetical protein BDR05DRAFT_606333 [Suillus weaverae]|nr:hypothetical protein BDR05DRAFT_606333 [Suillus weaverae]
MTNASASENLSGYRAAQWTAALCYLLVSLLGLVLVRSVGVVGHEKADDTVQPSRAEKRVQKPSAAIDHRRQSNVVITCFAFDPAEALCVDAMCALYSSPLVLHFGSGVLENLTDVSSRSIHRRSSSPPSHL